MKFMNFNCDRLHLYLVYFEFLKVWLVTEY